MNFTQAVSSVFNQYLGFYGRAPRSEYWYFTLFNFLAYIAFMLLDKAFGTNGILGILYSLAVLLPGLAVLIRRLHDTDRTGWWVLISLVPIIGFIVLLVFLVQKGTQGENKHGPDPLGG